MGVIPQTTTNGVHCLQQWTTTYMFNVRSKWSYPTTHGGVDSTVRDTLQLLPFINHTGWMVSPNHARGSGLTRPRTGESTLCEGHPPEPDSDLSTVHTKIGIIIDTTKGSLSYLLNKVINNKKLLTPPSPDIMTPSPPPGGGYPPYI